jgi:hypothetical protein
MTDDAAKNGNGKDDAFLTELENAVLRIVKNKKASKSDQLSAIANGVKIAAIRHKISGGTDTDGFFK